MDTTLSNSLFSIVEYSGGVINVDDTFDDDDDDDSTIISGVVLMIYIFIVTDGGRWTTNNLKTMREKCPTKCWCSILVFYVGSASELRYIIWRKVTRGEKMVGANMDDIEYTIWEDSED